MIVWIKNTKVPQRFRPAALFSEAIRAGRKAQRTQAPQLVDAF
jgi:hypothetical protein